MTQIKSPQKGFKYSVDLISVALVFFSIGISLLPIYIDLSWVWLLAIAVTLLMIKPITSLVQHNHVHVDIFHQRLLNTLFDWVLALSTGHIASEWVLHHNIGHHGNAINSLTDSSSVRHAKTRDYMSKWQYILTGSLKIYPDCCRMAWQLHQRQKKSYLIHLIGESLLLLAFYLYFLSVNLQMTLCFLILPNIINRALVWLGAYWHHLEVPAEHAYNSSNMYAGPFFNWISLNIGYHIAHHEKPSLHWSKLKTHTEQIKHQIPAQQILQKIP